MFPVLRNATIYLLGAAAVDALVVLFAGLFGHRQMDVFFTLSMAFGVLFLAAGYLLESASSPREREARRILFNAQTQLSDSQLSEMRSRADALVISGVVLLLVGFLAAVVRPF